MPVATLSMSHKTKIINCLLHSLSVDLKTKLQLKIALLKSPEKQYSVLEEAGLGAMCT